MEGSTLKEVLGENVRRFRKERGFTQERLAELVGREPSAISHIERMDRLMGIDLLVKLSDALTTSTDSLVRPKSTTTHLTSILGMLENQSDEALSHLEPIVRAWLTQYGDPPPSRGDG